MEVLFDSEVNMAVWVLSTSLAAAHKLLVTHKREECEHDKTINNRGSVHVTACRAGKRSE